MASVNLEHIQGSINVLNNKIGIPNRFDQQGKQVKGHFYIASGSGGYRLERSLLHGGGENVLRCGYLTKPDLYNRISAYLEGFVDAERLKDLLRKIYTAWLVADGFQIVTVPNGNVMHGIDEGEVWSGNIIAELEKDLILMFEGQKGLDERNAWMEEANKTDVPDNNIPF